MNYNQLLLAVEHEGLAAKVRAALHIAANRIARELASTPNHANRVKWAVSVLANPGAHLDPVMRAVVAQRSADDITAVRALTDSQVQTEVDSLIDFFAQG